MAFTLASDTTSGDEDGIGPKVVKMATTLGKLREFDPDSGNFEVYLERFELLAVANNLADEKKLQVFLTTIREKPYAPSGVYCFQRGLRKRHSKRLPRS